MIQMLEMKDEEMYCFVAPDGAPQLATLGEDFPTCLAFAELIASVGIGEHPAVLFARGFTILPVKLTITQNGDENTAFKKTKKRKP